MFRTHQPRIAAYGQSSPERFRQVTTFVLLTIQEPLSRMPDYMRRVEYAEDEYEWDLTPLWGFKRAAWDWWGYNAPRMYDECNALAGDPDKLLGLLCQCPGFGLAKGGFVAQLVWGVSGCLDSHNLKRWGIDPSVTRIGRVKPDYAVKRAAKYNALVERMGGTEHLWDSWCEYVAQAEGRRGAAALMPTCPFEVSALHCEALGLAA